ncbi:MAG: UDP-N-acetylglucosamine 4,6-dehydratase (inverting) [Deltaproteobacteria bacterium]|nr:UDP-N-acetylglucosamine 4,6-dehydratase (inverting) [Deltaproteobacteria bacterium]
MFNDKSVLITGGTGSFGQKMTRVLIQEYRPKKLIIFSRDELKQFEMAQKWNPARLPFLQYVLGDVRDRDRLMHVFKGVDCVIHAAALKMVPAAEGNPTEYIQTNVIGAMNVIDAALTNGVERVMALSTDKACNPVNLYGATKLCSDKLFAAANARREPSRTRFAIVRYGNVLGSRGSVVPFFRERAKTGKLPITDKRMTRFWITLDQAVHFVISTLEKARGGEIFVPRIPSMKLVDLARAIAPHCALEEVGMRPGERIHETLISEDDARNTIRFNNCYVICPHTPSPEELLKSYDGKGQICPEGFSYSSAGNSEWLGVEELKEIVGQIESDYAIEQSRWSMEDVPQ